jgi:hypothetical protein
MADATTRSDDVVTVRRELVATVSREHAMFLEAAELVVLPFLPGKRDDFARETFGGIGRANKMLRAVLTDLRDAPGTQDADELAQNVRALLADLDRSDAALDIMMRTFGAGLIAPPVDKGGTVQ